MSSLIPEVKCALCGRTLESLEDCFRASGDFLPAEDPLTAFCNVPMHWKCYEKWSERPRFAKCYVDAWVKANRKNPFWWTVHRDEHVYVSVNPQRPVEEASVRLCATGSDIRVPLPKWPLWLRDTARVTPGLRAAEKTALKTVLPKLRQRFPDDHAVVHAIDPKEKQRRRR